MQPIIRKSTVRPAIAGQPFNFRIGGPNTRSRVLKQSYSRRMSIAAGMLCRGGLMLCADTEMGAWTHTLHEGKIKRFQCPGGKVVVAYAGHSAFSISAIQRCERDLQHVDPPHTLEELERILEDEYRRHVLSHPDHATDGTLSYRMLIGFWCPSNKARLFVTTQTAMHEIHTYDCIGMGDYLGHYLIRPHFIQWLEERDALSLSAVMLAGVKGYVEGCSGLSCFVGLRDDGSIGDAFGMPAPIIQPRTSVEWIDYSSKAYQYLAGKLFMASANMQMSDSDFQKNLEYFTREITEMRQRWKENIVHESMIYLPVAGEQPTPKDATRDH
jgi:hypothetical protein